MRHVVNSHPCQFLFGGTSGVALVVFLLLAVRLTHQSFLIILPWFYGAGSLEGEIVLRLGGLHCGAVCRISGRLRFYGVQDEGITAQGVCFAFYQLYRFVCYEFVPGCAARVSIES